VFSLLALPHRWTSSPTRPAEPRPGRAGRGRAAAQHGRGGGGGARDPAGRAPAARLRAGLPRAGRGRRAGRGAAGPAAAAGCGRGCAAAAAGCRAGRACMRAGLAGVCSLIEWRAGHCGAIVLHPTVLRPGAARHWQPASVLPAPAPDSAAACAAGAPPRPSFTAVPPPGYGGAGAAAAPGPLTVTVPIGLDAAPEFGLAGRLRGPGAPTLALCVHGRMQTSLVCEFDPGPHRCRVRCRSWARLPGVSCEDTGRRGSRCALADGATAAGTPRSRPCGAGARTRGGRGAAGVLTLTLALRAGGRPRAQTAASWRTSRARRARRSRCAGAAPAAPTRAPRRCTWRSRRRRRRRPRPRGGWCSHSWTPCAATTAPPRLRSRRVLG